MKKVIVMLGILLLCGTIVGQNYKEGDFRNKDVKVRSIQIGTNASNMVTLNGTNDTGYVKTTGADYIYGVKTFYPPLVTQAGTNGNNVRIGISSLSAITSGYGNVAISPATLKSNTTGSGNIAIGDSAMRLITTGCNNIAIGSFALDAATNLTNSIAIGPYALSANTNSSAAGSVAIGYGALAVLNGIGISTAIGYTALNKSTSGINTAIGSMAMLGATTGSGNTTIGSVSLADLTDGNDNTVIGASAGRFTTSGDGNLFVGSLAGNANVTGNNNTILGSLSASQTPFPLGDGNVFIGYRAGDYTSGSNKLIINNTFGGVDTALIYGDFAAKTLEFNAITTVDCTLIVTETGSHFYDANASANLGIQTLSSSGTQQIVLNDLDAVASQEPMWYLQSANNGSKGIFYLGYADRSSGIIMTGMTDVMVVDQTSVTLGTTIGTGVHTLHAGNVSSPKIKQVATDTAGIGSTANVGTMMYFNGHFYGLKAGTPPTWVQLDN
jgi:hypothetical protein